jgi:NADH-quinone oxidoreductase subunit G
MTESDRELHDIIINVLKSDLTTPGLADIENYDAVLVLGEDVTNHSPRLALSLRQATRNLGKEMAVGVQIPQWHDAAVRELAQDDRSPLIVITPVEDRLDEVASQSIRLKPSDIAQMGFDIADAIAGNSNDVTPEITGIVSALTSAKRPLIVSGTGLQNPDIMRAATNTALALQATNPDTGMFLCASECNSVGVAMLDNDGSLNKLLESEPDLIILLENDLGHRLGHRFDSFVSGNKNLVVVDHLDNASTSAAQVVLPAATFAEAEGTFVNNEGRAQRSMAVYKPQGEIQASYQLLDRLNTSMGGNQRSSSELRQAIVDQNQALSGIIDAAPQADFRIQGSKSSRMTHRYSGRTAMLADVSVHEPKQPVDRESAMAFTMEGVQQQAPASLRAYIWSPGWNSNQSIHKFQSEIGGPDIGGDTGVLLVESTISLAAYAASPTEPSTLVGKHHIFGSEALSANAEELSQLIPRPYIRMNQSNANVLKVANGDGVSSQTPSRELRFAVIIDDDLSDDCLVYPLIPELTHLNGLKSIELTRVNDNWVSDTNPLSPKLAPGNLITSDRTS